LPSAEVKVVSMTALFRLLLTTLLSMRTASPDRIGRTKRTWKSSVGQVSKASWVVMIAMVWLMSAPAHSSPP